MHLDYLEERADLETDDGAILTEKGLARELLKDWDLEIDAAPSHPERDCGGSQDTEACPQHRVFDAQGYTSRQAP